MPVSSDVVLLCVGRHLVALLGYCNPLRCSNRRHRWLALRAEAGLSEDDQPLAALHRQTYVNRPVGERLTTLTFQSVHAALKCTVSTALGRGRMRCTHYEHGHTYDAVVAWTTLQRSDGLFDAVPFVVDGGGRGGLLLFTASAIVRFGTASAAVLTRDGSIGYTRPSRHIGGTRHLNPSSAK